MRRHTCQQYTVNCSYTTVHYIEILHTTMQWQRKKGELCGVYCISDKFDCSVQDCSNSIVLAMELLQSCTKPSNWPCINGTVLCFGYTQLLIKYAAPDLWPTVPIPPSNPVALHRPRYTDWGRDDWSYEYIISSGKAALSGQITYRTVDI